ncbi:MAG: ligase-associated DNA damage response endonuclease PdeM [Pseudomonadota bacterium]
MQTVAIAIFNKQWILDARKCLYWPEQSCLIVSDLHLEKAKTLNQTHPIPCYDSIDTLQRLESVINDYKPETLISLGDSFHTALSAKTLSPTLLAQINHLCAKVTTWYWILGNHDPKLPDTIQGHCIDTLSIADITFSHQPLDSTAYPFQVCGHYHPKIRVKLGMQKTTGACFIHSDQLFIMPAMGTFTGGLNIDDPSISKLITPKQRSVYLINNHKLWPMSTKP